MPQEPPPPAYDPDPANPFFDANPNASNTTPPRPDHLTLPHGSTENDLFYVITAGESVGLFTTWGVAGAHVTGVSGSRYKSRQGWAAAVAEYSTSYFNGTVQILMAGGSRFQSPGASFGEPYYVSSTAPTPARAGTHERPIFVGSSPIHTPSRQDHSTRPAHSRRVEATRTSTPSRAPAARAPSTPSRAPAARAPSTRSRAPAGHAPSTPSRGATHLAVDIEATPQSASQTRRPVLERIATQPTPQTRIRAIQEALDRYGTQFDGPPLPVSPVSTTPYHGTVYSRLSQLEDTVQGLLDREGLREAQFLAANDRIVRLFREHAQRHREARLDGSDGAELQLDGRDESPAPIAGSSTGPGTAQSATQLADPDPAVITHGVVPSQVDSEYYFSDYTTEDLAKLSA